MIQDGISILNINSHLADISLFAQERLKDYFENFGLSLQVFDIISINVNENDPSFVRLKEAKDLAAKLKIMGRDVYQMDRSFDVLEGAAKNPGGVAGGFMGAGLGMGAGMAAGGQMASVASHMNINPAPTAPPPVPSANVQYYVVVNGAQQGPYDINNLATAIQSGNVTKDQLVWKAGMANWAPANTLPELASYFNNTPPPVPPLS